MWHYGALEFKTNFNWIGHTFNLNGDLWIGRVKVSVRREDRSRSDDTQNSTTRSSTLRLSSWEMIQADCTVDLQVDESSQHKSGRLDTRCVWLLDTERFTRRFSLWSLAILSSLRRFSGGPLRDWILSAYNSTIFLGCYESRDVGSKWSLDYRDCLSWDSSIFCLGS